MPLLLLLLLAALTSHAAVQNRSSQSPVVRTEQGYVRGVVRGSTGVAEYKGLPFALPPTGADGRFRPPRTPAKSWTGVRDATRFQPNCLSDGFGRDPLGIGDEDCLYLNVYAPALKPSKPLPVLFWIYGGGFQGGGSNDTKLNGTWDVALAQGELVIVTSNYRVALWGWLASDHLRARDVEHNSTGNYGAQDQRAAMEWTHENIANFGGDPKRVFIVGQSAGSALVSCHLTRPASWPYFSAAGLESGAYYTGPTVAGAEVQFRALLQYLRCPSVSAGSTAVKCLLGKPASELLAANEYFQHHVPSTGLGGTYGWRPSIDGVEMLDQVPTLVYKAANKLPGGQLAPVPILIGSTREDLGGVGGAAVPPAPPDAPPAPPACDPTRCSEDDFRDWGRSLGFDQKTLDKFVHAYNDDESGHPVLPLGATQWYWAINHAKSDASRACPSRRMAEWSTQAGNSAFLYYWTYVPDAPGMCGHAACHACEIPFVFHVLGETAAELSEDPNRSSMINVSNPHEMVLSAQVATLWRSMAAYGAPRRPASNDNDNIAAVSWPTWPKFTLGHNPSTMVFGSTDPPGQAQQRYRSEKCDFWDNEFAKLIPLLLGQRDSNDKLDDSL